MSKYLSADDFIKGLVGEEEDVEVKGLGTVRIRPLTFVEAQRVNADMSVEIGERLVRATGLALVEPKLTEAQIGQLLQADAGRFTPLMNRVMALAGMIDDDDAENLAGSGS